jgi:hypothetical protein
MKNRQSDIHELKRIISEKDYLAIELSIVNLIEKYSKDEEILLLLCEIFESDWHFRHEDIALGFQKIKNPITSKALFNIAFSSFEYNNWNINYPLQRKCTWALADIGNEEARLYLQEIEKKANKTVSDFAKKRLDNWDKELIRKA